MPIENVATVLVKTANIPAGSNKSVCRWHGSVTRDELVNAPGGTGISHGNGMITLANNVYLDEDCTLDFSNLTINVTDKLFYIHPNADIFWQDILFFSSVTRNPRATLIDEGGDWSADGGGILGTHAGSDDKDRFHVRIGQISNVQIRQDGIGTNNIKYLPLNRKATYRNVKVLKVLGINTDGTKDARNTRIIMHDCEFRSSHASNTGTRLGVLNNGSMILNDCILGRMDGAVPVDGGVGANSWMFSNHSSGVTRIPHHVYFCGLTKTRWSPDWKRDSTLDTLLQSHQGGLRYYQVYKEGAIFGGCRYRLYSDLDIGDGNPAITAHRKSLVTLDDAAMAVLPSAPMGANGEFSVLTVSKTRLNVSNSWNTNTQTNHVLRIRERTIQFQDVIISDATISIGRPDTPVPFVVQPDPHFDAILADTTLANSKLRVHVNPGLKRIRIENASTMTIAALYSHLKIQFADDWDNFSHAFDITFDGDTLRLPGWNFELSPHAQLYATNGTRIICETLAAIPATATIHEGVTIIDSTGVTVTISSPAAAARCLVTYEGQTIRQGFYHAFDSGNLPHTLLIPLDTDVKVTVNAPGYIYETYTFNTNNQTQLDARLAKDPAIDLSITLSSTERNSIDVLSEITAFWVPLSSANDCEITISSINLYAQLGKSKRLVDWALSINDAALWYIHTYEDELTGAPLQGKAFVFEADRMRIDDTKLQFRRTAGVSSRCRLGLPVWTAGDQAYFAPLVSLIGAVNFDSLAAVADVPPDTLAAVIEIISTNDVYTGALSRAMWNYLITESLQDNSFGKLIKTNLDAKVSEAANKAQVGYFNILNREIAGGGLAAPILEGHGTNVHPQQLFLVSRTPRQNGPYYHAEMRLYDVSGGDDGAQYLGGEFIAGGATSPYEILAAEVNQNYLILGILAADGTTYQLHRIPLDTTDTSTTYAVLDLTFAPVAITINNTDIVIAKHASSTTTIYTIPLSFTSSSTLTERIAHPLAIQANNTGMTMTGAGEDAAITLITGDRIIQMSAADYSYISNDPLPFTGHNVIYWQDHIWTIRIHDVDNWYLQPLDENLEAIHTANIIHAIRKNAPENVWKVSGDAAHHTTNSIGAALVDIIVILDILTSEGGGLNPTNLNKLATIPDDVWGVAPSSPSSATAGGVLRTILNDFITLPTRVWEKTLTGPVNNTYGKLTQDIKEIVDSVPDASAIKTALEANGSDLDIIAKELTQNRRSGTDTISNVVDDIYERVQKIDGQTAGAGSYGWINFPTNTYATGYVIHDNILSLILQATNPTNHIIGKRIHTDTGLGIEDHTYHPITITNKTVIAVADSPDDTYFIVKNTDNNTYYVYQQNHGEQTEPTSLQLTQEPRALTWGPHGLYILELNGGNLHLRWTFNHTAQDYDTEITAGTGAASLAIIQGVAYIMHGGILRAVRLADEVNDAEMIDGVGATIQGDNLIVMHDVLWVYDSGRLYPLDGNHMPINTEWPLTQRARAESKIDDVKTNTDKMNFSGDGTDADPYLIDAHAASITEDDLSVDFSTTNDKIDAVKDIVDAIPTTTYGATLTSIINKIDAIKGGVDSIPTATQHTLQEIADAVRDMADYDDDTGTETSLKETLKLIISDIDTLESQLLLDTVDSQDTVLKRLKDSKTILDKFRFTSNDVKATLDGETVATTTTYATPANVTAAKDAIITEIDANETKIDTVITQTTASAISTAVESAFLDDTDGQAFLQQIYDKIEEAIEDESLATNALAIAIRREVWDHIVNPDDAEDDQVNAQSALNTAREQINDVVDVQLPAAAAVLTTIGNACTWLVQVGKADLEQDADTIILRDRDTKAEIIRFARRPPGPKSNWSGGRQKPILPGDQ